MKILIIRLSSMGDIVLTSPVVRCIREQVPQSEIHFLLKPAYADVYNQNPHITRLHFFDRSDKTLVKRLEAEQFDFVLDLQNNFRSGGIIRKLRKPYRRLRKLNLRKWLLVRCKINLMPDIHVVDRYMETTRILPYRVTNDRQGLDFFLSAVDFEPLNRLNLSAFATVAVGSRHYTKQIPPDILVALCRHIPYPVVFLGDESDKKHAEELTQALAGKAFNLCGKLSIRESAAFVARCQLILCADTGLMHIAAAFKKKIISFWGNTVPAFGMYPYMPDREHLYRIVECENLSCRPCSKLGKKRCPKKHFRCMREIDVQKAITWIRSK